MYHGVLFTIINFYIPIFTYLKKENGSSIKRAPKRVGAPYVYNLSCQKTYDTWYNTMTWYIFYENQYVLQSLSISYDTLYVI